MQRLFVAIDLPGKIRGEVGRLREDIPGVRWVLPKQLHLTLRFIGDADEEQSGRLITELSAIKFTKFTLELAETGFFQVHGIPRVLWAGVSLSSPLISLQKQIENACVAAGFLPDDRPFSPHLTVARIKDGTKDAIRCYVSTHGGFRSSRFVVKGFRLYTSVLDKEGATHRVMETVNADGCGSLDSR